MPDRADGDLLDGALPDLRTVEATGVGAVLVGGEAVEDGVGLTFPSSITLDGTFLPCGISAELKTAGLIEYDPADIAIRCYVDPISGEESTTFTLRENRYRSSLNRGRNFGSLTNGSVGKSPSRCSSNATQSGTVRRSWGWHRGRPSARLRPYQRVPRSGHESC